MAWSRKARKKPSVLPQHGCGAIRKRLRQTNAATPGYPGWNHQEFGIERRDENPGRVRTQRCVIATACLAMPAGCPIEHGQPIAHDEFIGLLHGDDLDDRPLGRKPCPLPFAQNADDKLAIPRSAERFNGFRPIVADHPRSLGDRLDVDPFATHGRLRESWTPFHRLCHST